MKKLGNWFAANWVELLLFLAATAGVVFVLWFGMASMLPGLTEAEAAQATTSSSLQKLLENPIGAPHKALQYITQKLLPGAVGVRSASALIGLFTIGCFYFVLRNWYSNRIAVLGVLTLTTSAWFLHTTRTGIDSSMYLLLFGAAAAITWLHKSRGKLLTILASGALVIMLFYIPGMIWLIVPAALWQANTISKLLKNRKPVVLAAIGILGLAALAPLGWTLYQNPELISMYLGLPQAFPNPTEIAHSIALVPVELFARGPNSPDIWLGRLPLLNVFTTVMFAIGLYAFFKKHQLDRTPFTIYVFVAGAILASLDGPVSISILMPFVYLVAAAGIALLLQQWRTVFPKNPFAQATGIILLAAVTLLSAHQGITQYFIAWPNTPETKQVHTQKLD